MFALLQPTNSAWADAFVNLDLPGGPDQRSVTTAFPEKGRMILQRSRPPLLETPFEVFDHGVFTPNDQFFVRWHWAVIPTQVDVAAFKLTVRGQVNQALSLSMADILAMPRVGVWSQPLMGHPYRVIRRMRYGPDSAWERHNDGCVPGQAFRGRHGV